MLRVPDFSSAPFILIWEVTRACALACKHCRAAAIDVRDPLELSTAEGLELLDDVAAMETPLVVLTGGDPLQRDDLEDLVRAGVARGLRMATIPAATPRLTRERLVSLKEAGVSQLAFSLDAPDAATHDAFRGVEGSFERTMFGARTTREIGVPLQINTVFGPWNIDRVDEVAAMVEQLGVSFWEVFVLVPVGRGTEAGELSPAQCEGLFAQLYAVANRVPFILKVAEAPHYRRYVIEQLLKEQAATAPERAAYLLERPASPGEGIGNSPRAVNAGRGFCFVDHHGDVHPSGFLPKPVGNVRDTSVSTLYREAPLFRQLRDPDALVGRCGRCEFRRVCGGSRSRAFALTGSPVATDPWCDYPPGQVPEALVLRVEQGRRGGHPGGAGGHPGGAGSHPGGAGGHPGAGRPPV